MPVAPTPSQTIIVSIDGLNASFLGPYGNTWFATPYFNRLAARSLLLESVFTSHLDPVRMTQETLRDFRAAAPTIPISIASDDERFIARTWPIDLLPESLDVSVRAGRQTSRIERTHAARCAQRSLAWLESRPVHTGLIWLHWSGLMAPWDSPRDLRMQLSDDDGPEATDWTSSDCATAARDTASELEDWRFQLQVTYAAQVQCWDYGLSLLIEGAQAALKNRSLNFLVLAPRGFSVGTHDSCGDFESLWDEVWHVPLFINQNGVDEMIRSPQLGSLQELGSNLAELFQESRLWRASSWLCCRNRVVVEGLPSVSISSSCVQAIKTPEWSLRSPLNRPSELYVRPDDRHQINDVADRVPEVAAELQAMLLNHPPTQACPAE